MATADYRKCVDSQARRDCFNAFRNQRKEARDLMPVIATLEDKCNQSGTTPPPNLDMWTYQLANVKRQETMLEQLRARRMELLPAATNRRRCPKVAAV